MKDKDLLNLLKKNGWEVKRIHGSHHIMQKDGKIETRSEEHTSELQSH